MGGLAGMQSFYRLFMAPGMDHCGSGPGPNAVGGVYGLPPPSRDPTHDVVAALAHWVEDGAAPEKIIATKYHEDNPTNGVEAQRPWCPYPAIASYSEQGDRKDATSYSCATTK
jgi:feruloyl esterase